MNFYKCIYFCWWLIPVFTYDVIVKQCDIEDIDKDPCGYNDVTTKERCEEVGCCYHKPTDINGKKSYIPHCYHSKHVDETIIFSPIITDVVISPSKVELKDPFIASNKDPIIEGSIINNWALPAEAPITNNWVPPVEDPMTNNWVPPVESSMTNNWYPYVEGPITNFDENSVVDSISSSGEFIFDPPETSLVGESKQGAGLPSNQPSDPFLADNETLLDSFIAAPPGPVAPSDTNTQKNPALTLMSIIQMKKANVSQDLINAYLADAIPGGILFYALQKQKLSRKEMIKLAQVKGITLNPAYAQYLIHNNTKALFYGQIAAAYGVDPTLIQLLMTKNNSPVMKHIAARLAADNKLDATTAYALTALKANGLTTTQVKNFLIDQAFSSQTFYQKEAIKAMMTGNENKAFQWALLASVHKRIPLTYYYPKHEIAFAYIVENQKLFPSTVNPSALFTLAFNDSIPTTNDKTFFKMFGTEANNYVCHSHVAAIRVTCRSLQPRTFASTANCIEAGCCPVQASDPNKMFECFENVLGKIGVGLAEKIWNEEYAINQVFDGKLPTTENIFPNGIWWLPIKPGNNRSVLSSPASNQPAWLQPLVVNGMAIKPLRTRSTNLASRNRPDFVWKPHGPTSFPTLMPDNSYPVATHAPGVVLGSAPVYVPPLPNIFKLPTFFPTLACKAVGAKYRHPCLDNLIALSTTGRAQCKALKCCFDPVWADFSVPICFRSVDYGQCYNVPVEKRKDCGGRGISRDQCLSNPRCCYNSTFSASDLQKYPNAPWCFYKLHSLIESNKRCPMVGYKDRKRCFPDRINLVVSRETCEGVGCCYEDPKFSYFFKALTKTKLPPTCYKLPEITLSPTEKPPTTVPAKNCQNSYKISPLLRKKCIAANYFSCLMKDCCFKEKSAPKAAPICFYKTSQCDGCGHHFSTPIATMFCPLDSFCNSLRC